MAWRNTNPSDYAPKSNAVGELLTGFAIGALRFGNQISNNDNIEF